MTHYIIIRWLLKVLRDNISDKNINQFGLFSKLVNFGKVFIFNN